MPLLSIAITAHDEAEYVEQLLLRLEKEWPRLDYERELVVLYHPAGEAVTHNAINSTQRRLGKDMRVFTRELSGDFAAHKNALNEHCQGQWILQLDADEQPPRGEFLRRMPELLAHADRAEADAFLLPRINLVDGLTEQHLMRWGWKVWKVDGVEVTSKPVAPDAPALQLLRKAGLVIEETPDTAGKVIVRHHGACVNWPDYQCRLYRSGCRWRGAVHEQLETERKKLMLPAATAWAIEHFKTIDRQEGQNERYRNMLG